MAKTKTLSVHAKRDNARKKERRLQGFLDQIHFRGPASPGSLGLLTARAELEEAKVPEWARGVRTESLIGGLLHVVVATESRGH